MYGDDAIRASALLALATVSSLLVGCCSYHGVQSAIPPNRCGLYVQSAGLSVDLLGQHVVVVGILGSAKGVESVAIELDHGRVCLPGESLRDFLGQEVVVSGVLRKRCIEMKVPPNAKYLQGPWGADEVGKTIRQEWWSLDDVIVLSAREARRLNRN